MSTDRPLPKFSPRERQLLQFASDGLTDSAIASQLRISEATVATYWGRIRIKLGPFSRTELVSIVLRAERSAAIDALRKENVNLKEALTLRANPENIASLTTFLDCAPDAMILVVESGHISHANEAAHELFGYDDHEMNGLELAALIPPSFRSLHREHREEFVRAPHRHEMGEHLDTPGVRKDGSEFPIRAALSAIESPEGLVVICSIRATASA